jgi:hypothetical protein
LLICLLILLAYFAYVVNCFNCCQHFFTAPLIARTERGLSIDVVAENKTTTATAATSAATLPLACYVSLPSVCEDIKYAKRRIVILWQQRQEIEE